MVIEVFVFIITMVIAYPTIFFVQVFIHECGHAIAMKLVGFNIYMFRVGPIIVIRDSDKYKLRMSMKACKTAIGRVEPVIDKEIRMFKLERMMWKIFVIQIAGHCIEIIFIVLMFMVGQGYDSFIAQVIFMFLPVLIFLLIVSTSKDLVVIYRCIFSKYKSEYVEIIYYYWSRKSDNKNTLLYESIFETARELPVEKIDISNVSFIYFILMIIEMFQDKRICGIPGYIMKVSDALFKELEVCDPEAYKFSELNIGKLSLLYYYLVYLIEIGSDKDVIFKKYKLLNEYKDSKVDVKVLSQKKRIEAFLY